MKLILKNWFRKAGAVGARFARRRAAHLRLGARGERVARRLLAELGLEIVARNYSGLHGELDIVAREDGVLCFIEVKTRHRLGRARPGAAVGTEKRHNLVRTAHQYLREIGRPPIPYRYDILEVILDSRLRDIRYHRNAFTEDDLRRPRAEIFPDLLND